MSGLWCSVVLGWEWISAHDLCIVKTVSFSILSSYLIHARHCAANLRSDGVAVVFSTVYLNVDMQDIYVF